MPKEVRSPLLARRWLTEIDSFRLVRALDYVDKRKLRSAWDKGVSLYSHELLQNLLYYTTMGEKLDGVIDAERKAMNGAKSWEEYSRGGFSLVCDEDIAGRLCTPTELRMCKGGLRNPNSHEDWIDVQARALFQAWEIVRSALVETAN